MSTPVVDPRTWQALPGATEETVPARRAFFLRLIQRHARADAAAFRKTDVPLSGNRLVQHNRIVQTE